MTQQINTSHFGQNQSFTSKEGFAITPHMQAEKDQRDNRVHQSADAIDVLESKKRYYKGMAKSLKDELLELKRQLQSYNQVGIQILEKDNVIEKQKQLV